MACSVSENGLSPRVPNGGAPGQGAGAAGDTSLFPNERPAFRPSKKKPRIGIKQWISQSVHELKGLGHRILKAERTENAEKKGLKVQPEDLEGDPLEDGKAIGKILRETDNRRFDLDWLDHCEDEFGRDWMGEFLTFLNNRYGFQDAVEIPDPLTEARDRKELRRLAKQNIEVGEALLKKLGDEEDEG